MGLLWVTAAAALGSLAGLPWIWFLAGPVPSILFALLCAVEGARLWRLPVASRPRVADVMVFGGFGAAIAFVFGNPSSYSWFDACFNAWGPEREPLVERAAVGLIGYIVVAVAVLILDGRRRVLAAMLEGDASFGGDHAVLRLAAWVAMSAILWSLVSELTFVRIMRDFRVGPCEPDMGPVALAGYAAAFVALAHAAYRSGRSRLRWTVVALAGAAALLIAQGARSVIVFHEKAVALERCGGLAACGCSACGWWDWP